MTPIINQDIAAKVLSVVDAGLVSGMGEPDADGRGIPGQMCVEAAVCYALGLPHGDDPQCVSPPLRALKIRLNDSRWSSNEARAKGLRRLAVAQLGSAGVLDEKKFVRRVVDHAIRKSCPQALRSAASVCKDKKHTVALIAAAVRCEAEGTLEAALEAKKIAAAAAAYAAYAYAANAAATAANADAYAATYAAYAYAANAAATAANADAYAATYAAYAANANADTDAYAYAYAYAADATYAANANANADAANAARDKSLAEYAEAVVQILIELNAPGCQWLFLTEAQGA